MAFRLQDPVTSLFWEVDDGYNLRLREKGTSYVINQDGSLQNPITGLFVNYAGSQIVESPVPKSWVFTENGGILADGVYYAQYSEMSEGVGVSSEAAQWVRVPDCAAPPAPVVAAPEPEPEEEDEPEPEEEDVPVTRGAALIEEALNTQAEDAAEEEEDNE